MFKGFGRGQFAVGLAIGLFTAVFCFVWLFSWLRDPNIYRDCQRNQTGDGCQISDKLTGFQLSEFITPVDTLAQWAMAILALVATAFSIIAVWLLWRTLEATQKSAQEVQRIGEAQTRAYLVITGGDFRFWELGYDGSVKVKNVGNSPAFCVTCKHNMTLIFDGGTQAERLQGFAANAGPGIDVEVGQTSNVRFHCSFNHEPPLKGEMASLNDAHSMIFWVEVFWTDVFDRPQSITTTLHAMKSDIDGGKFTRESSGELRVSESSNHRQPSRH